MRTCRMCGGGLVHDTHCESVRLQRKSEKREQTRKKERGKRAVEADAPGRQSRIDWHGTPLQQLRHWRNASQEQSSQDRSQGTAERQPSQREKP